jgi:hypothetical protein
MDTAPIIDGVINSGAGEEWSQVVSTSWSLTVGEEDILGGALGGGELPTDDTDLSATIFAGIADEHLYIAVQVLDDDISTDTVEAGSENGNTWQDDGIEIFIDGDNSNWDSRETSGTNPDVVATGGQFVITANNAYRHAEAGAKDSEFEKQFNPSSGWFAETKIVEGEGYHAEFRFPLAMIGNPQQGEHIGFTVRVNDEDGGGNATQSVITWVGVDHVESTFGNLVIGHRLYEGIKASPPVIDGKVNDDEYPGAEVVEVNSSTGIFVVGDDSQEEDNRYAWRLTHDQEAIYVGVKVWDTQIVADTAEANSEDGQTWVDDSVEIFFDSNESNKADRGQPADEEYDGQFVFTTNGAWRDNEANNPTYGEDADWWAQSTVADDGMSYEIEFVVKKATLVGGDIEDEQMGFNININDDDAGGGRKLQLNWDGVPHFEDSYGSLVLQSAIPSDPNAVADRSVRYGRIDVAAGSIQEALSFRNAGNATALTLSDATITGPNAAAFRIVSFPESIAPGESADAIIEFDSKGQTGSYTATIAYKTNDPDPTEADLTATLTASVLNLAGPIGRWSMDEVDGGEMLDITGYNRHGTFEAGPALGQDALATGNSVSFEGGSYGAVPGEAFDSFIRFSVAMWVNLPDVGGGDFGTLFAKGQEGASPTFALLNSAGTLQWFADGGAEFGTDDAVLTSGTTHHVVASWATGVASIYVDGVLVAFQDDPLEVVIDQANPFVVGSFYGGLESNGVIDDVQFYDRAITADDVANLFAAPGTELTNLENIPGSTITWADINLNTTASDLIGGSTVTFTPFAYDGGNADGTFWTGDGGTTGNAELDSVYNSHGWNGDSASILLEGLTAGSDYQIQLLGAGDTRACCDTRNQAASDGIGSVSGDFDRGNSSVVGSFTASSATQEVQIIAGTDNGVDPGLSGFILTDAAGNALFAANVGRTEGDDISVSTFTLALPDEPGVIPADSAADFGGPEVNNGWSYGYRNVDLENPTVDYDPANDFIKFGDEWWAGAQWDEPNADGDNVPWTAIGAESGHPNGDNNGEVHWTIRRWTSPGGPVDVTWSIAKQNVNCGNGVTGGVHHNGVRVDSETIASDDGEGISRTVTVETMIGDVIDLIHTPLGIDDTNNDGCDGAFSSMTIAPGTPEGGGDPVIDMLVLGADDAGEAGADANVLAFLRDTFGADNVRYLNSGATDGSETADVIVMSSTFGSGSVRGKFHNSAVPVVNWEEAVMDAGDGEFGQSLATMTKSTDTFQMALSNHPIAGDLAGTTIDFFTEVGAETLGSSEVSAGTDVVGTASGGSIDSLAMLFVTDAGGAVADTAGIAGNVSPARRVALPMTDVSFDSLSEAGKEIFANSIRWAAGVLGGGGNGALIAHFPLDSDGNSANGAFTASTVTDVEFTGSGANGNTGGSAVFNGSSSLIQHDWSADLNPESFTLALWAKSEGGAGAWNSPVTSRHDLNPDSQGYLIYDNQPDGNWTFWSGNGTAEGNWQVLDGPAATLGEWEHVAITYDNTTETKRLYINGVLAVEAADSITPNDTTPFNIGAGEDTGTGFHFAGEIDDIGLWDIALTDSQIKVAMNNGVAAALAGGGGGNLDEVPEITGVSISADGVALQLPVGTTYDIEYSADLVTWEVIASDVTGSYSDGDAGRASGATGYYRGIVK